MKFRLTEREKKNDVAHALSVIAQAIVDSGWVIDRQFMSRADVDFVVSRARPENPADDWEDTFGKTPRKLIARFSYGPVEGSSQSSRIIVLYISGPPSYIGVRRSTTRLRESEKLAEAVKEALTHL